MATLDEALRTGSLITYELPGWATAPRLRQLYLHPDFLENWADVHPTLLDPKQGTGGRTRHELLEMMLIDFCCAKRPDGGDLRRMKPHPYGVLRLQPFKLRIFGFVTTYGEFVALFGATQEETHSDTKLTGILVKKVRDFIIRNRLQDEVLKGEIYEIKARIRR
tara:strand:- start:1736 stop:2227 length:492 start_codon:yes stop_codon:yes gene_type:complete